MLKNRLRNARVSNLGRETRSIESQPNSPLPNGLCVPGQRPLPRRPTIGTFRVEGVRPAVHASSRPSRTRTAPDNTPGTAMGLRPSCPRCRGTVQHHHRKKAEALRAPARPIAPRCARGRRAGTDQQGITHGKGRQPLPTELQEGSRPNTQQWGSEKNVYIWNYPTIASCLVPDFKESEISMRCKPLASRVDQAEGRVVVPRVPRLFRIFEA